ncbi:alanine racemase [Microbacterium sp. K41]|uniref:alanine racemase n=1 Tax=Microbacterium sp. K41 TaxID=2305437 RepID=UPI00109D4E6D|nr:alanine racemase [Microbacterium sp. K41]
MTLPRLVVDLRRLRANIRELQRRSAPAEVMMIVKCDAYGHGLERVVTAAAAEGVRWFGAFDSATAVRARAAAGPDARVFAWVTMTRSEIAAAVRAGVTLGVGDADYLERIVEVNQRRPQPVHLKIDTGLHRSGIRPEHWTEVVRRAAELEAAGAIRVEGIWSHIAEVSDRDDDLARVAFRDAVQRAEALGLTPTVRHLAASAAGAARSEFRFDLVRFGAFVYGIRSVGAPPPDDIALASTLLAPVIRVDAEAVTIGIGSLDGLPSTLAGCFEVGTAAGARRVLRIGPTESVVRPWPRAAIGEEVAVWGPGARGELDATSLAELIGTVGEELLVRLSPLITREYRAGRRPGAG